MSRRSPAAAASAVLLLSLLGGCASAAPAEPEPGASELPGSAVDLDAISAAGTVSGWATVLQSDAEPPRLCLGAVFDSYPPQCEGPKIAGWDWDAVESEESESGVTWGGYAVTGTWDGHTFGVASATSSGLYDVAPYDPHTSPENAGATPAAALLQIQERLHGETSPVHPLGSWPENGYLFLQVIYDDGTVQHWMDTTFGTDVVVVLSALRDA